jgi:hypothetical protein
MIYLISVSGEKWDEISDKEVKPNEKNIPDKIKDIFVIEHEIIPEIKIITDDDEIVLKKLLHTFDIIGEDIYNND